MLWIVCSICVVVVVYMAMYQLVYVVPYVDNSVYVSYGVCMYSLHSMLVQLLSLVCMCVIFIV